MLGLVKSSIGTKLTGQFGDLIAVSVVLLCQVSYQLDSLHGLILLSI
jgi:hypothetical protein